MNTRYCHFCRDKYCFVDMYSLWMCIRKRGFWPTSYTNVMTERMLKVTVGHIHENNRLRPCWNLNIRNNSEMKKVIFCHTHSNLPLFSSIITLLLKLMLPHLFSPWNSKVNFSFISVLSLSFISHCRQSDIFGITDLTKHTDDGQFWHPLAELWVQSPCTDLYWSR